MVTALPALEVHFRCQLRIDSARPILGPSGPCARVMVHVYVGLSYGLPLAFIPSSGLMRLAWQQLDSCIVNWVQVGLYIPCPDGARGVHRALPRVCVRYVSGGLRSQNGILSLYQREITFSWRCAARPEAMVAIGEAVVYE